MPDPTLGGLALVAAGGALGGVARYLVGVRLNRPRFGWGTVVVNLAGSFLLALLVFGLLRRGQAGDALRLFLGVGFCGGFTTMSSFAHESVELLAEARWGAAALHLALNVVGSLAAAALGLLTAFALG